MTGADRSTVSWFQDEAARGSWNMAVDEILLQRAAGGQPPVLRFYQWAEPTLSLGYFQPYAERESHPPSRDCAAVRRATGGGAILHDRELTYSCVMPAGHPLGRRAADLYNAIHESIVVVLAEYGLAAQLFTCGQDGRGSTSEPSQDILGCGAIEHAGATTNKTRGTAFRDEPFLCFQRRTAGDVVLAGHKIVGSAQRRHRGAVLQHGSILLERSQFAPEIAGIRDITGLRLDVAEIATRLRISLSAQLGFDFVLEPPSAEIRERAIAAEAAKFAAGDWLHLR